MGPQKELPPHCTRRTFCDIEIIKKLLFRPAFHPVRSKVPQGACSTRFTRAASNGVNIAKGSAGEVRAQLYAAHDIGYVNIETFKRLKGLAEECSRLVSSFTKTVKAGSLSGLQRKYEKPKDEMEQFLKEHGYVAPWERKNS